MQAAKEKTLIYLAVLIYLRMVYQLMREVAASQNQVYDENESCNSEKSPISPIKKIGPIVPVVESPKPRKRIGESRLQLRRMHRALGTMYFRARFYNTKTGEFIQPDPLGYVGGMSLFRNYFGMVGVDPWGMDVIVITIHNPGSWKDLGGDVYECVDKECHLESLALKVSKDVSDWVCIWPKGTRNLWKNYPVAKCKAKADVSNLTATTGETDYAGIAQRDGPDEYLVAMRGLLKEKFRTVKSWSSGDDIAEKIKDWSKQGGNPFELLAVAGHGDGVGGARLGDNEGGKLFYVDDIFEAADEKDNGSNQYKHASKKIGPPKCWFIKGGRLDAFGCASNGFAKDWADRVQRKGAFVDGTKHFLFANKRNKSYYFTTDLKGENRVGGYATDYDGVKGLAESWERFNGTQ